MFRSLSLALIALLAALLLGAPAFAAPQKQKKLPDAPVVAAPQKNKQKNKQQFMWIKTWERVWKLCEYWTNTQQELKGYSELEACLRIVFRKDGKVVDHQRAIKKMKELLGVTDEDEGQVAEEGLGTGEGHEASGVESVHQGGSDPVDDGGGDRPS